MSVEIEPAELGFRRPFHHEVSEILRITNHNSTPVAFKVKTTAPKQYCVRPNSGRIEPGQAVEVTVLLQAMKHEPPMDAKCRDKFLVQSVAVTADKEFSNIAAIWQHVDNAEKSTVQEKKIRVVFLPPSSSAQPSPFSTPQRNGVSRDSETSDVAPPAYSSPRDISTPSNVAKYADKPHDSKSTNDARSSAITLDPASSRRESFSTPGQAASAPAADEPKAPLAEAKAQMGSMASEGGLKLRKAAASATGGGSENLGVMATHAASEGVSVRITAVLCLLSFLIAYFLF